MAPLEQVTIQGVPEGSNMAKPPHEILDTQARYLQDVMLDQLGLCRRRGTVTPVLGVTTFTDAAVGMTHAVNPAGAHKIGVLHGASSFSVLSDDYSAKTDLPWPASFNTAPYTVVDSKPALGGGTLIGTMAQCGYGTRELAYWRGGERPLWTTGTISVVRGSKVVNGVGTGWSVHCSPGMFLFGRADDPDGVLVYLGVVASVVSDTQVTLEENSLFNVTADTYELRPIRGVFPRYRFRATTTATAKTLTGQSSKFVANGLDGNWVVFRAADNAFVGQIDTVVGDTVASFAANAAVALDVEEVFAVKTDNGWPVTPPTLGSLNAVYAQRQWYCDGIDAFFSEQEDFEAVDMDRIAGNFIEIASTKMGAATRPINAVSSAHNSLLFLKENETFQLVGSDPTSFDLHKLIDDGALSGMSVQQYQGGVLFAGRDGIYFYDGVEATNIIHDRLGDYYKALVRTFDPETHRMWSLVTRDCYKVFIERVTASYGPTKGLAINKPTRMTISIYLPTRAVTFMTNTNLRGSIEMPANSGKGVWYIVNTATGARICSTNDLFDTTGNDTLTCVGDTIGPDFYIESKRYGLGDDLRKKLFKQMSMHYYVGGDDLLMDTVVGLNEQGATSISHWLKSVLDWNRLTAIAHTWDNVPLLYPTWDELGQPRFAVKRIKFLKRSQHLGFRLYQASNLVTQIKLGPWALGFKVQRVGRI